MYEKINPSFKFLSSTKAFRIVSIYLALSLFWIFSTDKLVFKFISDAETQNLVSSIKGWFFVIVTTLLLYHLIRRALKEVTTAEQNLIESEIKFRSVCENSVDAIGVSKEGIHVFVNPSYLALFGYSHIDELVGKPIIDLIAPGKREYILDIVTCRAKGEVVPSTYETVGFRKDGSEFDMDVNVSSYLLDHENYTLLILRDITERKQVEDFNRLLFNASPIGLVLCRMDGSLMEINPVYAKILGRTTDEALKLTYWDVTPEKYTSIETIQLKSLEETGSYGPYEKEYIHKDGHLVPVRLQGLIIERKGEKFIWSSVEDITDRKQIEEVLRESEERFRILADTTSTAIFIYQGEKFVYCNKSARSVSENRKSIKKIDIGTFE